MTFLLFLCVPQISPLHLGGSSNMPVEQELERVLPAMHQAYPPLKKAGKQKVQRVRVVLKLSNNQQNFTQI